MRIPSLRALGTGSLLAGAAARLLACSPAPPPTGGGSTTASAATTTHATTGSGTGAASATTSSSTGSGGASPPIPMPCPNWPGWETWDDFAPDCPLCVPTSAAALPSPIEWVPCDDVVGMPVGCRQMKVDWPWKDTAFGYTAAVDVADDGRVFLDILRVSPDDEKPFRMKVLAEADGPVHSAFLDIRGKNIKGCTNFMANSVSAGQGKTIMSVIRGDTNKIPYPEAAVGGSYDELHPRAQKVWDASRGHRFAASDVLWATSDGIEVGVAFWGQPWQVVSGPDLVGALNQSRVKPWHDFVTWEADNGIVLGVMAWTPDRGTYPFLTFPGDWTRGAGALGTDGHDMVWGYAEGKTAHDVLAPYTARSVMTSPHTTDPAQLAPRRLRSIPQTPDLVSRWIVGCGHAAIEYDSDKILIVRLSDGWSWQLTMPNPSAPPIEHWHFGTVYGMTCDEVFLRGGAGVQMNVVRVRLDALGPGMPPD